MNNLTIVTSCTRYGGYLADWAKSILAQTTKPAAVVIVTHGTNADHIHGQSTAVLLNRHQIPTRHFHEASTLDFGVARNKAVAAADTEWVMHLDADDMLLPGALEEFAALAPSADVISAGYVTTGPRVFTRSRPRLYASADGKAALNLSALCSGISPFRRALWEQSPYRTDMLGAWDTALWIGFAHLGARFRATRRAVFQYRQHEDSVFNIRRRILGWSRVKTQAQLRALRRQYRGVDIIVPLSPSLSSERRVAWDYVKAHYTIHHPDWKVIEGLCPAGPWVKGAAIAHGVSASSAEIIVIADADCLVNPSQLRRMVSSVQSNEAPWGMPHRTVYRATANATKQLLAIAPSAELPKPSALAREPYEGAEGGGIVVFRRVDYDSIGGMPLAFRGWGSEDRALACLADHLLGKGARGSADLIHLWHTPQDQREQPKANLQLLRLLGHAAQQGKDALVSVAYTLPGTGSKYAKMNHGTARPVPVAVQLLKRHLP